MHYFSVFDEYKRAIKHQPAMISSAISYKDSVIYYLKSGWGERILFLFHGYGESAGSFEMLAEKLTDRFTIIAVDLPFHGRTAWNEGSPVKPQEFVDIMDAIAGKESKRLSPWLICGYSMGGRIALTILQLVPERIRHLILLAPDGLKSNGWYWLATHTFLGNRLFKFTMHHPAWFMGVLKTGKRFNLVNQSIYKFSISYLQDARVRMDLYQRWTGLKDFRPSIGKIKKMLMKENIPVDLIYGRFDRIIRYEQADKVRSGIENRTRVTILDAGHQLIHPKTLDAIVKIIIG